MCWNLLQHPLLLLGPIDRRHFLIDVESILCVSLALNCVPPFASLTAEALQYPRSLVAFLVQRCRPKCLRAQLVAQVVDGRPQLVESSVCFIEARLPTSLDALPHVVERSCFCVSFCVNFCLCLCFCRFFSAARTPLSGQEAGAKGVSISSLLLTGRSCSSSRSNDQSQRYRTCVACSFQHRGASRTRCRSLLLASRLLAHLIWHQERRGVTGWPINTMQ